MRYAVFKAMAVESVVMTSVDGSNMYVTASHVNHLKLMNAARTSFTSSYSDAPSLLFSLERITVESSPDADMPAEFAAKSTVEPEEDEEKEVVKGGGGLSPLDVATVASAAAFGVAVLAELAVGAMKIVSA